MTIKTNKYQIRFFRVGNGSKGGDAILITLYDDNDTPHLVLIDGGYKETGESIVKHLKMVYSTPVIDIIFNTHPDRDHISGLLPVVNDTSITINYLAFNRPWKDAGFTNDFFRDKRITPYSLMERIRDSFQYADELEESAKKRQIEMLPIATGLSYFNGIIQVLSPTKEFYTSHLLLSEKTPDSIFEELNKVFVHKECEEEDYTSGNGPIEWFEEEVTSPINETSAIITLILGNMKFLFTGDAGKEALRDAINYFKEKSNLPKDAKMNFTRLQLPHHGSRKNIDPSILDTISASTYIISCPPKGEKEGHPSRRLINKILEMNPKARIFTTASCSSFVFYEGLNLNLNIQQPAKISKKMDGKEKS